MIRFPVPARKLTALGTLTIDRLQFPHNQSVSVAGFSAMKGPPRSSRTEIPDGGLSAKTVRATFRCSVVVAVSVRSPPPPRWRCSRPARRRADRRRRAIARRASASCEISVGRNARRAAPLRERLMRPWSSISMTLTMTSSPTFDDVFDLRRRASARAG